MNSGDRYDVDEVRLALRAQVHSVCAALGIEGRGRREIESQSCPRAQHSRRRSCVITVRTGLWHCMPCGTGGDMVAMVAAAKGLDVKRDWWRVVAVAAELAGVRPMSPDPMDAERRRRDVAERAAAEHRRIEREEAADAARRAVAIAAAAATWPTLSITAARGAEYLRSRGMDPSALEGLVRYAEDGVAVPLHDRAGAVRNVVVRRYPELLTEDDDRKVMGRKHCPAAGTLLGHVAQLGEGRDMAVLTEGVADTLAAAVIWPEAVVLGAHGAEQLQYIAEVAAPRIRELGGWLLLVPHNDDAGVRAGIAAGREAQAAGMVLDRDLRLVDLGAHNDLADAIAAGWRWSWPS